MGRSSLAARIWRKQLKPLHVGEAEVEDHEIRLVGHELEGGLGVRGIHGLIALGLEPHAQQFADRRLVVDHKNLEGRCAHAAVSSRAAGLGTGSAMVNTAPGRSARLAAVIVPPMASMKPREMASPSPVPART